MDKSLFSSFVLMVVGLIFVIGLAFVFIRYILPYLVGGRAIGRIKGKGQIDVIERFGVDPKKSLLLIQVGQKVLLIGISENNIQYLTEIEDFIAETPPSIKK